MKGTSADYFRRLSCWCRDETTIAFLNYYKYHNNGLNKTFVIQEKCHGLEERDDNECLHWHESERMVCQDYPADFPILSTASMNTLCYHNRGHGIFTEGNEANILWFNGHIRNLEKNRITENATRAEMDQGCSEICWKAFDLPIMLTWKPSQGVLESSSQLWVDWWMLNVCDGCGGLGHGVGKGPGEGIPNDKGGPDNDTSGHYGPEGYYDTSGYDGGFLFDRAP
ncbi:MAG: hypothetical protein Q9222_002345 [Ikaeria aurantiellina]